MDWVKKNYVVKTVHLRVSFISVISEMSDIRVREPK